MVTVASVREFWRVKTAWSLALGRLGSTQPIRAKLNPEKKNKKQVKKICMHKKIKKCLFKFILLYFVIIVFFFLLRNIYQR
jgi:hypothetical protein